MTNYYYIATGQNRQVELYDLANEKMYYYSTGGNKMYVLRHTYEDYNGYNRVIRDWYVKTLSKNIDVAIEKAKEWVKENGEKNHDLRIKSDYQEVDPNGTIPQWVKDIQKSNAIIREKERKENLEKEKQRLLEIEKNNKKRMKDLQKSNFVGQPKERLEKKLTLLKFIRIGVDPITYGAPDWMNIITLEDEDKNQYTYFGTADIGTDLEKDYETRDKNNKVINFVEPKDRVGNTYTIKFTVKKHNTYVPNHLKDLFKSYNFEGIKQTVIQRPKVIN